jgi:hypothetical protein
MCPNGLQWSHVAYIRSNSGQHSQKGDRPPLTALNGSCICDNFQSSAPCHGDRDNGGYDSEPSGHLLAWVAIQRKAAL